MKNEGDQQADARARKMAASIQAKHRWWLVMWSPWRRQFTAMGCFAPVPIIIDEADRIELLQRMRAEELRFTQGLAGGPR